MQVQLYTNLARDSAEMLCPLLPLSVQDVQSEPAQHTDPLLNCRFVQSPPFPLDQFVWLLTPEMTQQGVKSRAYAWWLYA